MPASGCRRFGACHPLLGCRGDGGRGARREYYPRSAVLSFGKERMEFIVFKVECRNGRVRVGADV